MRCGFHFTYKDLELVYHKTLPYSTIFEKDSDGRDCAILYDILIKQTGRIDSDWDGTVLDVEKYSRVTFEPYDLKWLEKVAEPGAKRLRPEFFSCDVFPFVRDKGGGMMSTKTVYRVAVIGGDGIGPEVLREGQKALAAVAQKDGRFSFEFTEFPLGL